MSTLIRFVCGVSALILVTYVLCAVGRANPNNWLVLQVGDWSSGLTLGLAGLFPQDTPDFQTIADYGFPALVWLTAGWVSHRVLMLFGAR